MATTNRRQRRKRRTRHSYKRGRETFLYVCVCFCVSVLVMNAAAPLTLSVQAGDKVPVHVWCYMLASPTTLANTKKEKKGWNCWVDAVGRDIYLFFLVLFYRGDAKGPTGIWSVLSVPGAFIFSLATRWKICTKIRLDVIRTELNLNGNGDYCNQRKLNKMFESFVN